MPKRSSKAAENPRRGWRENLREFVIVVAGVFVALVAQQAVDAWNWHRKVVAAEAAMRGELLDDDGPQIYQRAAMHRCVLAQLDRIRAAVEGGGDRAQIGQTIDGYWVDVRTYDELALDAANASDIASHVSQDQLRHFFIPYEAMPLLEQTNADEGAQMARMRAFRRSGGPVSDAEKDRVVEAVETLRNDENVIWGRALIKLPELQFVGPLNRKRVRAFLADARAHYGDCVMPLPADSATGEVR